MEEVKLGRILGPFTEAPIKNLMLSPTCVIPKANGKHRLIFNLSAPRNFSVNSNIPEAHRSTQYCNITDAALWLTECDSGNNAFMAKVDLSDAYRMVPIKHSDWRFLGMVVGNEIFIDRCLPMGAASSCHTFQSISNALSWIVSTTSPVGLQVFNYIDDFFLLGHSEEECPAGLNYLLAIFKELGVPVSPTKTISPTQSIIFLGIGVNAATKTLFVPKEKAQKTNSASRSFLSEKSSRVKEWQRILGKLMHLSEVISSGRIYLSSVYGSLKGILSQRGSTRRKIGEEARDDLSVWEKFLDIPPNRDF